MSKRVRQYLGDVLGRRAATTANRQCPMRRLPRAGKHRPLSDTTSYRHGWSVADAETAEKSIPRAISSRHVGSRVGGGVKTECIVGNESAEVVDWDVARDLDLQ